ncbi:hypothetical protein [Streptomyces niveiscabiei]|uniref:Uncharacterized protein n=1 Tax=Streptomyces niveiscabiei TaxID=164115 RepID=A0ABW9I4E2_9ACTN
MTVRVCNAISTLPLEDLRVVVEDHGETLSDKDRAQYAGPVFCELAVEHDMDGAHCTYVKEWDDESGDLWWRWLTNGAGEFVSALACEVSSNDADPQACFLTVDHPREHSWDIEHPEREEAARESRRLFPGW